MLARCRQDGALRVASLFRTQPAMLHSPLAVIETDRRLCSESFPWKYSDEQAQAQPDPAAAVSSKDRAVLAVCVQNGSNAFFVCKVQDVQVSAAHAIPAVMRMSREANWPRIRVLLIAQRDADRDAMDDSAENSGAGLPSLPTAVIRRIFNFLVIHNANFPQQR